MKTGHKRAKKVKKTKSPVKLIILTIITTIIAVILSLSKYKTAKADSDIAAVAVPILSISSGTVSNIEINPVDNVNEYVFKVQNYDETSNSDVTMNYKIQIQNLANLPLDFELYTYENDVEGDELLDGKTITDTLTITYGNNNADAYKLKIKWKDGENSYKYSGIIDYVQIMFSSTQVD